MPVYASGNDFDPETTEANELPLYFAKGKRIIVGSMMVVNFDEHAFTYLFDKYGVDSVTELPPLDVVIVGINEHGNMARMACLGVEFTQETGGFSLADLGNNSGLSFVAQSVVYWRQCNWDSLEEEFGFEFIPVEPEYDEAEWGDIEEITPDENKIYLGNCCKQANGSFEVGTFETEGFVELDKKSVLFLVDDSELAEALWEQEIEVLDFSETDGNQYLAFVEWFANYLEEGIVLNLNDYIFVSYLNEPLDPIVRAMLFGLEQYHLGA